MLGADDIARRLEGYAALEAERGATAWVVVACHNERHERDWRRAAERLARVPVATGVPSTGLGAHEAIWRPLFGLGAPVRLVDLAAHPVPEASTARAAAGGRHSSRFVLQESRWWSAQ